SADLFGSVKVPSLGHDFESDSLPVERFLRLARVFVVHDALVKPSTLSTAIDGSAMATSGSNPQPSHSAAGFASVLQGHRARNRTDSHKARTGVTRSLRLLRYESQSGSRCISDSKKRLTSS